MSLHDFLTLLVTAALIILAAAVYSPFAESLSPVFLQVQGLTRACTHKLRSSGKVNRCLPHPKTDIYRVEIDVREVPITDIPTNLGRQRRPDFF